MRQLAIILLAAASAMAAGSYRSSATCTVAGGIEYCVAVDGHFYVFQGNGQVATSDRTGVERYTVTGDALNIVTDDRTRMKITPLVSKEGVSSTMFENRKTLWIGDASGCVTKKFFQGDTAAFMKRYSFVPLDRYDLLIDKISQCMARK